MNARAELLQIIARLETMSHVPAVNLNPQPVTTEDGKGGARPRGGIDREDDRQHDFTLKSADHYRRRLHGCRTVRDVELVLADARQTLAAWARTPEPRDPEWGSFAWRRQIVRDIETGKRTLDACRSHYSVSRATIYRYLAMYGQDKAA